MGSTFFFQPTGASFRRLRLRIRGREGKLMSMQTITAGTALQRNSAHKGHVSFCQEAINAGR